MKVNRIIGLLFILVLYSCSNTKDITMFREEMGNYRPFLAPSKPFEHTIQPFDNLYLSILTLDPEVNQIFDPSLAGNGYPSSRNLYDTPSGQYIYGYRVSAEGTITLPILGELNLVGLNLMEAEARLKSKAEEYLKEPTVQVKFLNYKVNVSGEINSPGVYYNYEGNINILEAISMAQGITDYADLHNVSVKRYLGDNIYTYSVNLTDNSVFASEVYYLQPNDLVYIPPTKLKRRRENSDTYSKFLGTLSLLLVAVTLVLNN